MEEERGGEEEEGDEDEDKVVRGGQAISHRMTVTAHP